MSNAVSAATGLSQSIQLQQEGERRSGGRTALSAAYTAHDCNEFARLDVQIDIIQPPRG